MQTIKGEICILNQYIIQMAWLMWLGMDVFMLNKCDLFGRAGVVSFMQENADVKHIINRLIDMSYIKNI